MSELTIRIQQGGDASVAAAASSASGGLYLDAHQARDREPTIAENAIADVIERCYAAGTHTCDGIVSELNRAGVLGPDGRPWTEESFKREMTRLGA
jgi:hypothetical protein